MSTNEGLCADSCAISVEQAMSDEWLHPLSDAEIREFRDRDPLVAPVDAQPRPFLKGHL